MRSTTTASKVTWRELERLLPAMLPHIDLPRALLRGRFMRAAAQIEWNGVPIDTATLALLRQYWTDIQDDLIADVDADYGVFDGRSFRLERWERWLVVHGIPWPRLESGRLDLSDDTFRQMARAYPAVSPMRELRSALSEMRLIRSCGWQGRTKPHAVVRIPIAHRTLPAFQHPLHFWPERVVAKLDQAAARIRCRVCGLVPAGTRHCREALR